MMHHGQIKKRSATLDSYAAGPRQELIEYTIPEALSRTSAGHPDRAALVSRHQNTRLTWRELDSAVSQWAGALRSLGLEKGDRVGVWSTNCAEWVLLQLAAARAGLVLVNVNPAYRSHELAYVLEKSRMKALFYWKADARTNFHEILQAAVEGRRLTLRRSIVFRSDEWNAAVSAAQPYAVECDRNDVVNIQYTSGTTGFPKGVLLTHRNILNNGALVASRMRLTERDVLCSPVPLYHCFGCVMGVLAGVHTGATLVLPNWVFDPLATLEAIQAERATAIYGVPTMFIAQLEHPEFARFDLKSLRTGIMAGAPCPVEVMKRVVRDMHCGEMLIAYGQTESSPVSTMSHTTDPIEVRVGTVGSVMPNTEVKIINPDNGQTVPVGTQGELCSRGYLVMKGYDGDEQATRQAVDADSWLHSGDLATMREDGNFRITGRSRDMIIRGGENIYPREIEEFLYSHPAVADVQVVGLPDEKYGEMVCAWVRLKSGAAVSEDELREFARARIAHFKVPKIIRFVDSYPMTVTGKIQKFRIREMEIERLGLQQAASAETA
jgi:fatty-acyl-CoA synthase